MGFEETSVDNVVDDLIQEWFDSDFLRAVQAADFDYTDASNPEVREFIATQLPGTVQEELPPNQYDRDLRIYSAIRDDAPYGVDNVYSHLAKESVTDERRRSERPGASQSLTQRMREAIEGEEIAQKGLELVWATKTLEGLSLDDELINELLDSIYKNMDQESQALVSKESFLNHSVNFGFMNRVQPTDKMLDAIQATYEPLWQDKDDVVRSLVDTYIDKRLRRATASNYHDVFEQVQNDLESRLGPVFSEVYNDD